MENTEVKVGIADLNLVSSPNKIMTIGLGSCIGIALYDRRSKLAGLSHIMLPDSTQFKNVTNPMKFADLAIPLLIKKMEAKGCQKRNLIAKIAGGASMFSFSDKSMVGDIGKRNIQAVKKSLSEERIQIIAEDVGGNKGRTMILDALDGKVTLKIVGIGIVEL
ncbi:chemoreceptor glutamine deamidase CheD [Clostridium botulinum]|uniref:Probable chemoreceptor glutamine deamidase CheD n=1 Tax=Clostridium botulinum (strain Eklund 17B / Type B) TaxID=935198 RepID=CHED_CLOBB|nr:MULTISPECIES: chemoreceptor glutamine deamidase CheD [Clostridium]B2TLQ3.1 RecName: Full=Probable chemoreceptor glutamine deamidase CheD [Clostridium botulinum B str. Eklund 17B (NRP)]AIY79587.1 cheD chemotactic sensory transduction family protein [Clostridium botulinum 202F]KAI3346509.1 chemoreceptor glutamine deamidase CheD [Clostridium botulinum]ACD23257.1 chemoreceptor glutamine deamidase CheD [Clostridium botulinum B str. Eklund 17B (NRP)]KFX54793.1 chemotaxis protein CheD [Clostridium